jgi:hypothetical protein
LTVLGRYLLTVIDQELELLQIAARTPAGLSTTATPTCRDDAIILRAIFR